MSLTHLFNMKKLQKLGLPLLSKLFYQSFRLILPESNFKPNDLILEWTRSFTLIAHLKSNTERAVVADLIITISTAMTNLDRKIRIMTKVTTGTIGVDCQAMKYALELLVILHKIARIVAAIDHLKEIQDVKGGIMITVANMKDMKGEEIALEVKIENETTVEATIGMSIKIGGIMIVRKINTMMIEGTKMTSMEIIGGRIEEIMAGAR